MSKFASKEDNITITKFNSKTKLLRIIIVFILFASFILHLLTLNSAIATTQTITGTEDVEESV